MYPPGTDMSIGVLLITHPGIGQSILLGAKRIYGSTPLNIFCLEVPVDGNIERIRSQTAGLIAQLNEGQGVLILTDLYGATPNNIARGFAHTGQVAVLSGLSLPMLLRVFNYANEDNLSSLSGKAAEGAQRSVCPCYGHPE